MEDDALPTLPSERMPYSTFRERLKELGMQPLTESEGGSYRARWEGVGLKIVVEHSGYGGGCGGRRPVRIERYHVEQPRGPELPVEKQRIVADVLRKLTAAAPPVQPYHPAMLVDQLSRFWEELGCTRFRVVFAPAEHVELLAGAETLRDRLLAYAQIAERLGTELRVARSSKGPVAVWPVVFAGDRESLTSKVDEVVAAIGNSRYLVANASSELVVEDPIPVSAESARSLAPRIADRKKRGGATRVQVDAVEPEALTLSEKADVAAIKAALGNLIDASKAKEYVVESGGREVVKQRKLSKLATRFHTRLKEGATVVIRPATEPRPGAQLEL